MFRNYYAVIKLKSYGLDTIKCLTSLPLTKFVKLHTPFIAQFITTGDTDNVKPQALTGDIALASS